MKRHILTGLLAVIFSQIITAQYKWQDPLDFGSVEIIDKYALLYNLGGVILSGVFGKHKDHKGYWETAFYAEYQQEYNPHKSTTDVFMGKARFGRQLHQWLQIGAEVQLIKFKNSETSTTGIGGTTYFNWYFINNDFFRFYLDNGFGVVTTASSFPLGGTSFNFTSFYGLSISFKIQGDTHMKMGVRNMHLSNAYLFGEDRNPAFDSIGFHIGFEL